MPEVTAGFLHDGEATSVPLVSESAKNRPACGDCRLSVFVRLIWDCVTGDAAFTVTYRVECQVFKVVSCPSEVERARPAPHDADWRADGRGLLRNVFVCRLRLLQVKKRSHSLIGSLY